MTAARVPPTVFLLGAPRSGTTLLYKLLCLHPRAGWISNYHRRLPGIPQVDVVDRVARRWPAAADRAWFDGANAYVYGRPRRLAERLFPMPVEGEPVFRRWGLPEDGGAVDPDATRRGRRARASVRRTLAWGGADLLVSKRIGHNRRVAPLDEAFPTARFVHLVRDGRAVASSLADVDWWPEQHLWWHRGTSRDWCRNGGDPWEACARHWLAEVDAAEDGLAAIDGDRVLRLRYEDLVARPLEEVTRVAAFAGLEATAAWTRRVAGVPVPDGSNRWRARLDGEALRVVEQVQGRKLRLLGYA